MPGDHGLGFHDGQRRMPARPQSGESHPEETISGTEVDTTFLKPSKDDDLLAQGDDLRLKPQTALEPGTNEGKQEKIGVHMVKRRV